MFIPEVSMHSPSGPFNVALLAIPPSPLKLAVPIPAYVEMIPVDTEIKRMRLLLLSLRYTSPLESMAMPDGSLTALLVA